MSSSDDQKIRCPSGMCELGSSLLGVINRSGEVEYLGRPLQLSEAFIKSANQGRQPEKRFRFTTTCQEQGCKQWGNGRCSVIDEVTYALSEDGDSEHLPRCGIRDSCRWFMQAGKAACAVCNLVVTDTNHE